MKLIEKNNFIAFNKEPVLLMTASILPQEKNYIKLKNDKKRLEQYIDSLKFYIKNTKVNKIVFCDNSNYSFNKKGILMLAKNYGKNIEILQFAGDCQKIEQRGKGYGEGEIIKYAIENSKLLLEADYFIKVTGRIKILNIDKIKNDINIRKVYFNKSIIEYQAIDTVVFGIPKKIYMKYFLNAYKKVYDKKAIYIEHVIGKTILQHNIVIHNIPLYPDIEGIRGTTGTPYQENMRLEKFVYNYLSRLNLFNVNLIYNVIFFMYFNKFKRKHGNEG